MSAINKIHSFWSATVEIAPNIGNDLIGSAAGAYVSAVGIAKSKSEFISNVGRAMSALNFKVVDIDDVCILKSENIGSVDERILNGIKLLSEDNPVELGSFHLFSGGR